MKHSAVVTTVGARSHGEDDPAVALYQASCLCGWVADQTYTRYQRACKAYQRHANGAADGPWLPPLAPLPAHLEALRQTVANLPDDERRQLLGRITGDNIRRNDERHAQFAVEAERQRKGRR